jgi:thiol:disulfide interchange protein DsbC
MRAGFFLHKIAQLGGFPLHSHECTNKHFFKIPEIIETEGIFMFIKHLKHILFLASVAIVATKAGAETKTAAEMAAEASKIKINNILDLPITGMRAIESDRGVIFISSDGRFAFKGMMYDIWNQGQYSTLAEIKESAFKVSLEKMSINVDSLNTFTLGRGAKQVVMFVDPYCPYCHKVIDQALSLQDDYTFKIVMIATLGDNSSREVLRAACAKNKADVIPAMLSNTLDSLDLKPQQDCNPSIVAKSATTAQVLGVTGVPHIITPNGTVIRGLAKDFVSQLANN